MEVGQEGTVGEMGQHGWPAGGLLRTRNLAPVLVELVKERGGVEGPVEQDEHARVQQRQQPPGQGGLVSVGR